MKTLLVAGMVITAIQFTAFSQEQKPTTDASTNGVDKTTAKETGRDGRFIAYDNGTVLDTKTKLMWAAKDNGSALSWPDAKSYCENYRVGSYTDWRMPTFDELAGLYDTAKTYKSDGESQASLEQLKQLHNEQVDKMLADTHRNDVHLTELIHLTYTEAWTSQIRPGFPDSVLVFDFHYGTDALRPDSQDFRDTAVRALPARSSK